MNKIYPNRPELDRAAWILATMSPDMVDDIIQLVNDRQGSLKNDLFGKDAIPSETALIRYNSILSRDYISDLDFPEVLLGLSAAFAAELRKPNFSTDRYSAILQNAFSIPASMAESMASRIDTQDPITDADKNEPWYAELKNSIVEGVRKALNYGAGLLNLDWEIDQNQDYDLDFLYEMKLLGRQVTELNSRARLMNAQAMLRASSGYMATKGDPLGDPSSAELGDALQPFMLKRMPTQFFGGASKIVKLGTAASKMNLKNQLDQAGLDATLKPTTHTPRDPEKRNLLNGIANLEPGKAIMMGAGLGLTPALIRGLMKVISGQGLMNGDPTSSEAIREVYGDVAADMAVNGNLEPLIDLIIADSNRDYSTGDPRLDADIDKEINAATLLQAGGPFQQLRVNFMRRQAAARRRRNIRTSGRMQRRERKFNERQRMKDLRDRTYMGQQYDPSEVNEDPFDQGGSQGFDYPDDEFFEDGFS